MGWLKSFVKNAAFSEKYSLNARMVNVISMLGVVTVLVALVLRIATGVPIILDILVALIAVACFIFLLFHLKLKMFGVGKWILALSFCDILIPAAFFFLGGIDSSISVFFVLTAVIFYLLMEGKTRIVLLVTHFIIVGGCFLLGYIYPEWVYKLTMEQRLVDQFFSTIIVACFIGTVFVFQRVLFERERLKVSSSNSLLEKSLQHQALTADIAQSFVTGTSATMDELIASALGKVGSFLGVERVLISVNNLEEGTTEVAHHRVADQKWVPAPVSARGFEDIIIADFPKSPPPDSEIPAVCCSDIFAEYDGRYAIFSEVGLKAFIWSPLYVDNKLWGIISIEECEHTRNWGSSDISLVSSVNSALAGAIARELTDKALALALEQATIASKAKGDFLSNMSHEIRTPLNAVIGMTSIGKKSADVERKDYAFEKIEEASNHLLGVVNDILDMSKIEANKLELSEISFNFEHMLRKVANVVNFRVEQRQQVFHVCIDPEIPQLLIGDDQRLAQVITNLLSNAIRFTPEQGTIRLDAKLVDCAVGDAACAGSAAGDDAVCDGGSAAGDGGVRRAVGDGGDAAHVACAGGAAGEAMGDGGDFCTLQIDISDTGIGITEEQLSRLFRSFEQAESGTSRKFGGTGLGLAISRRIVELMSGDIWVKSEPGKGSTFSFTVKLRRASEPVEKSDRLGLLSSGVDWSNIRIIAVDDDQMVLEFFANLSAQIGISCDTAASGEQALRLLAKNGDYDIYFIDWRMPQMNGLELSSHIKALGGKRSVITMISATEWSNISDQAKSCGVTKYLAKPLFPSAVTELITECIGYNVTIQNAGGKETEPKDARPLHQPETIAANAASKRAQEQTPKDLREIDVETDESNLTETYAGSRILLAEDIDINREIVLCLLESTKLDIVTAENGIAAIRIFANNPESFQMIFMDVQMPEMDGLEATRRIRAMANDWAKKVPIVAMTANVFREDVEKCLAAGMNDHVGKPIYLEEVMQKLRKYLRS